jgi:hypothetical protein
MNMNYQESDTLGIYKNSDDNGPGPHLMGANTLNGNDVYNEQDEDLGEVKEIMLDMRSGKVRMRFCPSAASLVWGENFLPCRGQP